MTSFTSLFPPKDICTHTVVCTPDNHGSVSYADPNIPFRHKGLKLTHKAFGRNTALFILPPSRNLCVPTYCSAKYISAIWICYTASSANKMTYAVHGLMELTCFRTLCKRLWEFQWKVDGCALELNCSHYYTSNKSIHCRANLLALSLTYPSIFRSLLGHSSII